MNAKELGWEALSKYHVDAILDLCDTFSVCMEPIYASFLVIVLVYDVEGMKICMRERMTTLS